MQQEVSVISARSAGSPVCGGQQGRMESSGRESLPGCFGTDRKNRSEMEGKDMSDLSNTQFFQVEPGPQISAKDILEIVFKALKEKGYNPVNQIVGYVMSGDPTYITSYNGARSLVMKVERDELVEELLKAYIEHNSWA